MTEEWPDLADICGVKYEDKDLSGGLSESDVAKAGWTIYLHNDVNQDGDCDQGTDTLVAQTTTDAYGKYCFENLQEGYCVVVEDADGPDGNWFAPRTRCCRRRSASRARKSGASTSSTPATARSAARSTGTRTAPAPSRRAIRC